MAKDDAELIKKWANAEFEDVWKDLRFGKSQRGQMIAKTTRKYVAKYFFYAGMDLILQPPKET